MKAEWTNKDNLSIDETTGHNSKAILVVDIPICEECPCFHEDRSVCQAGGLYGKPCPLRPLPIKNKYKHDSMATVDPEHDITLADFQNFGWNACLDEITGDEE